MATAKTNTREPVRNPTAHDLAFGTGRKFTDEEISLLIKEHANDTFIDGDLAVKNIIKKLKKNTFIFK